MEGVYGSFELSRSNHADLQSSQRWAVEAKPRRGFAEGREENGGLQVGMGGFLSGVGEGLRMVSGGDRGWTPSTGLRAGDAQGRRRRGEVGGTSVLSSIGACGIFR